MKKIISDCNGMQTYAELTECSFPEGYKYLKITSTYERAKMPNDERTRFEMLLSPESLENLKDILSQNDIQ